MPAEEGWARSYRVVLGAMCEAASLPVTQGFKPPGGGPDKAFDRPGRRASEVVEPAVATPGTSTRDLMDRMGHDSMQAALIYQHATRDADQRIVDALEKEIEQAARDREDVKTREMSHGYRTNSPGGRFKIGPGRL